MLPITSALTKAEKQTLRVEEVMAVIQESEGKKSDANGARGHPLQHVQKTATRRKTEYSEKRLWDEIKGVGSHTCFKTEGQQAELVRKALCSNNGQQGLRALNSGGNQVTVKFTIGKDETETVITQGYLGGVFDFVFCVDGLAKEIVLELHSTTPPNGKYVPVRYLHIRSVYPKL